VRLSFASVALLGVFALLFRDYRSDHFFSAGIACLLAGLLVAIPAAILSWSLLRRGFAVNPVAAGLVRGALAGGSGVTMLELHCGNFQTLHVLVWPTVVAPVSAGAGAGAGAGALVGWALRRRPQSLPDSLEQFRLKRYDAEHSARHGPRDSVE
jgi:hypothetical protein